jgi:hypothetical protein
MNPLLAQELKIPGIQPPPATSDPITWITLFLVTCLVGLIFLDRRDRAKERGDERSSAERIATAAQSANAEAIQAFREELQAIRKGYDEAVATFRLELISLREEHVEQIKLRDERDGERNGRLHGRIDCVVEDLTAIRTKVGA